MKIQPLIPRAGGVLLILALLVATMSSSAAASNSLSTTTLTPSADAYVNSASPATNYGTGTTLRVDGSPDVHSYLIFTVANLGGQSVTSATLRLYANSASSAGLTAMAVADTTWSETAINYNNMPAVGASLGTSAAVATGTWVSVDVSSYVTGEGTFGFAVGTPGATAISLASRESGANAPQLVLGLGGSGGGATPTTAASNTPTSGATATNGPPTGTPTSGPTATGAPLTSTPTSAPTATGAASTSTPTSGPTATDTTASGPIQHVFVIWMENHSYSQVWNVSSTPYLTSLGKSFSRATNFYATSHPSLPNYLDFAGGSNYSITTDCNPSSSCHVNGPNLGDSLEAKGLSWKAYEESMASPCAITSSGNYAPKHNPFVYFDDMRNNAARCNSHDVNFSVLATDLARASSTPNFAFITPNQCSDMHSCSITTGDTWLKNHVPAILNSEACTVEKCLLVVSFDEDNDSSGNHVLTIFAGPAAKTGGAVSSVKYTHYSMLRTIEYIFGLSTLTNNDANASPMTDLLK